MDGENMFYNIVPITDIASYPTLCSLFKYNNSTYDFIL